jgi:hypothetical protein
MSVEETSFNKTQGQELNLLCFRCQFKTAHKILFSVDLEGQASWSEEFKGYLIFYGSTHQIVRCQGCRQVSFRENYSNSEAARYDANGELIDEGDVEKLYPSRVAGRPKIDEIYSLPLKIQQIYEETHYAYCNGLLILTGLGIRTLVEAVCADNEAQGKNLEQKIDSLVSVGVLTRVSADFLHSMRIMGNAAAHEAKPHSKDTLSLALEIVENLLRMIYILPSKAHILPQRK